MKEMPPKLDESGGEEEEVLQVYEAARWLQEQCTTQLGMSPEDADNRAREFKNVATRMVVTGDARGKTPMELAQMRLEKLKAKPETKN